MSPQARELLNEVKLRGCLPFYLYKNNPSLPAAELPLHRGAFNEVSL